MTALQIALLTLLIGIASAANIRVLYKGRYPAAGRSGSLIVQESGNIPDHKTSEFISNFGSWSNNAYYCYESNSGQLVVTCHRQASSKEAAQQMIQEMKAIANAHI